MRRQQLWGLGVVVFGLLLLAYFLAMSDGVEKLPSDLNPTSGTAAANDEDGSAPTSGKSSTSDQALKSTPFSEPEPKNNSASLKSGRGALHLTVRRRQDESPVANREGVLVLAHHSAFWPPSVRARTNEAGLMKFENLKPGRVELQVPWHKNAAWTIKSGEVLKETLWLEATPPILGRVVDKSGRGVAGARVMVGYPLNFYDATVEVARTGPSGHFELRDSELVLPATLSAAHAEFAPSEGLVIASELEAALDHILTLEAKGGRFQGVVSDQEKNPVRGARVFVGPIHPRPTNSTDQRRRRGALGSLAITDVDGRFDAIGTPLGDQSVTIVAQGFSPLKSSVTIEEGITATAEFELSESCTIRGKVVDSEGNIVDQADIRFIIKSGELQSQFAAHEAKFQKGDLPVGATIIMADDRAGASAEVELTTLPGSVNDVVIKLQPVPDIRGVLVDASGAPQAGWQVESSTVGMMRRNHSSDRTNDQGEFLIKNCSEKSYYLTLRSPEPKTELAYGVNQVTIDHGEVTPGGAPLRIVVPAVTKANAWISGRVRGPDGVLLQGVTCELSSRQSRRRGAIPVDQATGEFRIGPLIDGSWSVKLLAHGYAASTRDVLELRGGESRDLGDIELQKGGKLECSFSGAKDLMRGRSATLTLVRPEGFLGESLIVKNNSVTTSLINPGRYRYNFQGHRAVSVSGAVEIKVDTTTKLVIPIRPGVPQRIEITNVPAEIRSMQWHLVIREAGDATKLLWDLPVLARGEPVKVSFGGAPGVAYEFILRDTLGDRQFSKIFMGASIRSKVHSFSMP